jgi:integrase
MPQPIVKGMRRRSRRSAPARRYWPTVRSTTLDRVRDRRQGPVRCVLPVGSAVLFLAASRRTEAAATSWFEMESLARDDFRGDAWTCPKGRMKSGKDHLTPVTEAIRGLIGEQPKDSRKQPYVFSTTGGL